MPGDRRPSTRPAEPPALRELLREIVDYAGLFPPAGLEMGAAVANYARYRSGADAWALGRFVVPATRLDELAAAVAALGAEAGEAPWRLSALAGPDVGADLERVRVFEEEGSRRGGVEIRVDSVELRAATPEEVRSGLARVPETLVPYVEIPVDRDPGELVAALRDAGARAKVRTGGVTPESFPAPEALVRFVRACGEADLPFKATAGLHHPVRGSYRLTYERDSSTATMYGYLNLLFATALLRLDAPEDRVHAALGESHAEAFRFDADAVSWRDLRLTRGEIAALRERGMVAFGSCSFREPLDELATLAGAAGAARPQTAIS